MPKGQTPLRKNPPASFSLWITDLLASMVFVFLLILVIHSLALKTEQEKLLKEKEKLLNERGGIAHKRMDNLV